MKGSNVMKRNNGLLLGVLAALSLAFFISAIGATFAAAYASGESASPAISEASVGLSENIIVNFKAKNLTAGKSATMKFSYLGTEYEIVKTADEKGEAVFGFDKVTPQCLGDNISATLYVDGEEVDALEEYSVKSYLETVLAMSAEQLSQTHRENAAMKKLIVDLLYYGQEAQKYADHNAETLVTSGLTVAQKAFRTDYVDLEESDRGLEGEASEKFGWKGAGLYLDYNVSMYFKIAVKEEIEDLSIRIGETAITDFSVEEDENVTYYTAIYRNITLLDFDTVYTATVYEGETAIGKTASYSVKSYVYAMQNNDACGDLAKAIYNYGKSAVAYKHFIGHTGETGYDVHDYDVKEDTIGVQTFGACGDCGHELVEDGSILALYHNYTTADTIGENSSAFGASTNARKTLVLRTTGNATHKPAAEISTNADFLSNFFGGATTGAEGAGVRYTFYSAGAGTAVVVFKVASGYVTTPDEDGYGWAYNNASTGDMVFNKVFKVKVNGVEKSVADNVILEGKGPGNYSVMANWVYVPVEINVRYGENTVDLVSICPYDEDGSYLYTTKDKKDKNAEQSSPTVDTVAVYTDLTVSESKTLTGITIATNPAKTEYNEDDLLDLTGLVVYANYSNYEDTIISDYTSTPAEGTALTPDVDTVTISYRGMTETVAITVTAKDLKLIISTMPTKLDYKVGEDFDATGMVVSRSVSGVVTALSSGDYEVIGGNDLTDASVVKVEYTYENDTVYATIPVTVLYGECDLTKADNITNDDKDDGKAGAAQGTNAAVQGKAYGSTYLANLYEGDVVSFTVTSTYATKASIILAASSTRGKYYGGSKRDGVTVSGNQQHPAAADDMQVNKILEIYVNGTKYDISNAVIIEGYDNGTSANFGTVFGNFVEVTLADVDLRAGNNTIELVFHYGTEGYASYTTSKGAACSPYIDYYRVKYLTGYTDDDSVAEPEEE